MLGANYLEFELFVPGTGIGVMKGFGLRHKSRDSLTRIVAIRTRFTNKHGYDSINGAILGYENEPVLFRTYLYNGHDTNSAQEYFAVSETGEEKAYVYGTF